MSKYTWLHSFTKLLWLFTELHEGRMTDYSAAIYGLIAFALVITAGVVYVLAQPTDLPSVKKRGTDHDSSIPSARLRRCLRVCVVFGISCHDPGIEIQIQNG